MDSGFPPKAKKTLRNGSPADNRTSKTLLDAFLESPQTSKTLRSGVRKREVSSRTLCQEREAAVAMRILNTTMAVDLPYRIGEPLIYGHGASEVGGRSVVRLESGTIRTARR
jgi:hypothetical protein